MARYSNHLSVIILERLPDKDGDLSEPRVLSPMADVMATQVGHVLVSWGQMMDWFLRYTRSLIAFNGTDKLGARDPDFRTLSRRFVEEYEKAFYDCPLAARIAKDAHFRANRAKSVRTDLAHSRIYWGTSPQGATELVVNFQTKIGQWRQKHIQLSSLESALQDISIAQGRFFQLAQRNVRLPDYSPTEASKLRAIEAMGFMGLPNTPELKRPQSPIV